MKTKIIIFAISFFLLISSVLSAEDFSISGSAFCGFIPSIGGNLNSRTQEIYFGSNSGIDGMNRSMDGYNTSKIERLTGINFGLGLRAIFYDYFLAAAGVNYSMSVFGGKGNSVYYDGAGYNPLKCEYSFREYDFPITIGLSIPFWKDVRASVSCGTSIAYAEYKNKFESTATTDPFASQRSISGSFSGWAFPFVVIVQADYYIRPELSLTSAIYYYKGATKVLKDKADDDGNIDCASIDFTGFRFNLGVSYVFYIK
jgi:hypothetical protein